MWSYGSTAELTHITSASFLEDMNSQEQLGFKSLGDRLSPYRRNDKTTQSKGTGAERRIIAVPSQTTFHHLSTPLLIVNGSFSRVNTLRQMLRNQHQGKLRMLLALPQHLFSWRRTNKVTLEMSMCQCAKYA